MSAPGVNAPAYTALDSLCEVLERWCSSQGLPYQSADELALDPQCTPEQYQWLMIYSRLWDRTCKSS